MAHTGTVTTPPPDSGGGSLVAPQFDIVIDVNYAPAHDLSAADERRHWEIIERASKRFYDKLQSLLGDPQPDAED